MPDFDPLTGISIFLAAARAGSFTAAAERLGITKSAVGKSVARLEERRAMLERLHGALRRRAAIGVADVRFA